MNRFVVLLLVFSCLEAQEKITDTLSTVSFPEIVVTATRSTISRTDSPSPVEVLRSDNISAGIGNSADELLLRANGLVLQDLGGEGALKTASLRGTAPQHLLILVNGTRLTSFQNGLVDLSLLPLTDIDRIEVLRGGTSALYGADALGGVVNVLTRSPGSDLRGRAEANIGSFGFRRWAVEGDGRIGPVGLLAGFMQAEGTDDYPFSIRRPGVPDSTTKRENSDFRRQQAYLHGDAMLDRSSILTFMGRIARAEGGVPGSLTFPSPEARQKDDNANLQLGYRTDALRGIAVELQSAFHYGLQNYRDPNPFFPIDTYYHNSSVMVNPQFRANPFGAFRLTFGGELGEARLRGGDFSGIVRRTQQALYLCGEYQWNFDRPWGDRLSVFGTARYDSFSDVDKVVTPKVGMNLRLLKDGDVRLRASYGRSFRAPSFNDLYFVGFNNPNLKPERSSNADIGLMAAWAFLGRHSMEVTWYSLRMNDRIVFDLNTFRPENIGQSSSNGIEARYSGAVWNDALVLTANYTYTDTRKLNRDSPGDPTYNKRLPFIPTHLFNLTVTVELDPVSFSLYHHIAGRRFTNDDNSQSLPIYRYTNFSASVPIPLGAGKLHLAASIDNIFGHEFSIVPGYPMPGRRLKAGIRFET